MATLTSTRAADGFQQNGGEFRVAWGTYVLAANPTAGDVIELCKVPAGATVVGGYLSAVDLDTNATEELDIDIGWAANGVDAADEDGFGNLGVITGDAVAGYMTVAGSMIPLQGKLITEGPITFNAETTIQLDVNVDAATGGTGRITAVVYYHTA
jgi:hypothetical protein